MGKTDEIISLLQDNIALYRINGQLGLAVNSFPGLTADIRTHADFNDQLANFVKHIFSKGLPADRNISKSKALAEAINLLEQHFESQGASGYAAAYLETISPNGKGFNFVLSQLAEIIKGLEIHRYTNWLFLTRYDHLDWGRQRQLVENIFKNYGEYLPAELIQTDPVYFVGHYRDLVESIISANNILAQIAQAAEKSPS